MAILGERASPEQAGSRPTGGRVASPGLVGRSEELTRLVSTASSPPAVLVVEGEAGVGKTRLVTALLAQQELRQQLILTGGCHRIREPFPLGPVIEAVRGLSPHLGRTRLSPVAGALREMLPELSKQLPPPLDPPPDGHTFRHLVFRGLVEVLRSAGPGVLVLEDMHWADDQTVEFVHYLLNDPPKQLAVVLTLRGEDAEPHMRAVAVEPTQRMTRLHLAVTPFDEQATGALAAAILRTDRVTDDFATYLHERTAGLPFAVEELLALLLERQKLPHDTNPYWNRSLADMDVPAGIKVPVLERVSHLSDRARPYIDAAAVLQTPTRVAVLAGMYQASQADAAAGLEEALSAGVLVTQGDRIGFRHLLAAQAVYDSIPLPRRQRLHARAASVVDTGGQAPLGQVAHHLYQAGQTSDWVEAAERAADQATALGDDAEATRLLEGVLCDAPLSSATQGRLAVKLGRAAIEARDCTQAIRLLTEALECELPRDVRGELRFRLAMLLAHNRADPRTYRRLLAEAVDELSDRPGLQAGAMTVLAAPVVPGVPLAEHKRWLDRATELLPTIEDTPHRTLLTGKVAMVRLSIGDPHWRTLTDRMTAQVGSRNLLRHEANAFLSVGLQALYAGHLHTASQLLTAAAAGAEVVVGQWLELRIRSALTLVDYCRGAWDGLAVRVADLLDELADYPPGRVEVEVVAGCLALASGDLPAAARLLNQSINSLAEAGAYDLLPIPINAMARLAVASDSPGRSLDDLETALDSVISRYLWPSAVRALPSVTQALLSVGQTQRARQLVQRFTRGLADLDAPLAPAALAHARGVLAVADDPAAAQQHFLVAANEYESWRCPYEVAQAREQAATVGFANGTNEAATLVQALERYQRLAATWDRDRAAEIARRYEVPVAGRHRGGRRGYGQALSPRQRQVAELAARGLSNQEIARTLFLSVNTVQRHMTAVMRKLDVQSRAAIVHRLDNTDVPDLRG